MRASTRLSLKRPSPARRLHHAQLRRAWKPHGYGYGWFIGTVAGHPGYYHPGDNPGYQSFNARLHDPAIRFAVLTNDETTDLRSVVADLVELECGDRFPAAETY